MKLLKVKNPKTDKYITSTGEVIEFVKGTGFEIKWIDEKPYMVDGKLNYERI